MGARVWRSVSLVPACSVVLGTLIVPAAQSVATRPPNGDIIFVSDRRGADNLYVARPDGSGVQELTHSSLPVNAVQALPTGQRLAVTVFKDSLQATEIWVTDLAGRRARRITKAREFVSDSGVHWSPDGKRLAFVREDDENERFSAYVVALDGSPPKPIHRSENLTSPAWSPDGERIAFNETDELGDECGIVTMRADGSDRRRVPTTRRLCAYAAAWTPDGRMLTVGARNGVYTIALDGKPVRRLIGWQGTSYEDLQWSPDGKNLVLTTYDPGAGRGGIALVSSAGRLTWLTNGARDTSPTWIDSTSLFFKRGSDLWKVRIGGLPAARHALSPRERARVVTGRIHDRVHSARPRTVRHEHLRDEAGRPLALAAARAEPLVRALAGLGTGRTPARLHAGATVVRIDLDSQS